MKSMKREEMIALSRQLEEQMESLQKEVHWNYDVLRKALAAEDNIMNLEQKISQLKKEHSDIMADLYRSVGKEEEKVVMKVVGGGGK